LLKKNARSRANFPLMFYEYNENMLEVPEGLGHCGPITHTDSFASLAECVQAILGILDKQWDTKEL
jgi:hypothetical protein